MIRPTHRATATEQSSKSIPLCRGGFLSMLGMKRCAHTVFRWGYRREEPAVARRHSMGCSECGEDRGLRTAATYRARYWTKDCGCAVERFSGRHPAARQRERLTCDRLEDIAFLACILIVGVV